MPDSPKQRFDRYLDRVERDPAWQARQERIRRVKGGKPLHPFKVAPFGFVVVAIGVVVGWWLGFPKG